MGILESPWVKVGKLREVGDIAGLVALLDDPAVLRSDRVRSHIVFQLARASNPIALPALVRVMKHDASRKLRLDAAYLLARHEKVAEAESALIETLEAAEDFRLRMHAARGLASLSSARAAAALVRALEDPHGDVRWEVVDSLGFIGISRPEVIGPLTGALEDRKGRVRVTAAKSLARLGATSALPALRRARARAWPPWRVMLGQAIKTLEQS